jgi:hypothetical protein
MDFSQLAARYGKLPDAFGNYEDEDVGNAKPVTQTIKTDPDTGEQTMTIKGSPYDLSAANPNTPTVTMPTGGINSLAGPQDRMTPSQPAAVRNAPMLFDDTSGAQGTGYMNQQTPAGDQVTPLGQGAPVPPMITPQAPMDNMNGNTAQAMAPAATTAVQPAPGYDPESIAQILQQAGLNYAPPQPIATLAQAGLNDANPVTVSPPAPQMGGGGLRVPAAMAPTAAVTPAAVNQPPPVAAGAAYTRQAESDNNYDVGYNRAGASDAFGAYQILSRTYRDIQKADPYFAGKDQKTLSPADQDRANNVIRELNTSGLKAEGIEPSEGALQVAHFLGAKGTADFLSRGYIDPAAAAANGGYAKASQIAIKRYLDNGGDPTKLPSQSVLEANGKADQMNQMVENKDYSALRNFAQTNASTAAGQQALSLLMDAGKVTKETDKIKAEMERTAGTPEQNRMIGNWLKSKNEEGNWGKWFISGLLGIKNVYADESAKLGIGATNQAVTLPDGSIGYIKVRADGVPIEGNTDKGPMTPTQITAFADQAVSLGKGVHINKTETYIDPASGQIVSHQTLSNGKERFTAGGRAFTGDRAALVPEKQFSAAEDRRVQTAMDSLRRNVPNPTEQQVYQALVSAKVPNRRIEQEMGLASGSMGEGTGRVSTGQTVPTGAGAGNIPNITAPETTGASASTAGPIMPPLSETLASANRTSQLPSPLLPIRPGEQAPPAAQTQPAAVTTAAPVREQAAPSPVITPDVRPVKATPRDIKPGERKDQYDAYLKGLEDNYQKQLQSFETKVKMEQTEAQAFRATRFATRDRLRDMAEGINVIDSGKHNLGPNFSMAGAGPLPSVQQFFGEQFGTEDSANTSKLLSMITKDGLQGIKDSMGPSISNFDVQSWLKANPIKPNSPPEQIKKWLIKTHDVMLDEAESKKQVAVKHGMVESTFNLGKPLAGAQSQSDVMNRADKIINRGRP